MKAARVQLVENTTERVSRILAGSYGIQVVFKGDLCCTDGKRIFLPVLGDNAPEELLETIPGMVDHETGHIIDSDFDVLKTIKNEKHPQKLHTITNICEDARIEANQIKRWRGCRPNLQKLADYCCAKLMDRWPQISEWGKLTQMCGAVAGLGDDHWFTKEVSEIEPELWKYVEEVKPLLQKAKDQNSTKDELLLAKEILEKLHSLADPPSEPEKGEDENANSQGDQKVPGVPDIDEDDDQDGQNRTSSETNTDDKLDSDNSKAPQCLSRDEDLTEKQVKQDENYTNRNKMIQEEAKKVQQESRGEYLVYSTDKDVIKPVTGGNSQEAKDLLEQSRQITNVMRMKMMRNLLAQNKSHRDPGKERGKIDRRALFRVPIGTSKRVFWQKTEAPEFNTRASLWVDHSGSMSGQKIRLAAASAMLFGEVLDSLKIPFEVCGFSTSTSSYQGCDIYKEAKPEDQNVFTRWGGLWIGIYKSFEESWHMTKQRCSNMDRNHHDNTYDGECLRIAAKRLLEYPEPRKILFWFNDGEPCPNIPYFMSAHEEYLHRVAKEVEKVIEVFAVGIMSDSVKDYFSNAVVINDLKDLPKVMLGELDRLLRKNQQVYLGA